MSRKGGCDERIVEKGYEGKNIDKELISLLSRYLDNYTFDIFFQKHQ